MWHQTVGKLEISASDLEIEKILELGRRVVAAARVLSLSHADSFNTENFTESITCEKRGCARVIVVAYLGLGVWGRRRKGKGGEGRDEGRAPFI